MVLRFWVFGWNWILIRCVLIGRLLNWHALNKEDSFFPLDDKVMRWGYIVGGFVHYFFSEHLVSSYIETRSISIVN